MSDLNQKIKLARLQKEPGIPFNEGTLDWENRRNNFILDIILKQYNLPKVPTYLVGKNLFEPLARETGYLGDVDRLGGFARKFKLDTAFSNNPSLRNKIDNAIVLNLDNQLGVGFLPYTYKHEFKHKYLPTIIEDIDKFKTVSLPKNIGDFLKNYPKEKRTEELAAYLFSDVPNKDLNKNLRQELVNRLLKKNYPYLYEEPNS